jgi:hypothetical protein
LRPEDGYWPNAWNASRWAEAALAVVEAAESRGTPFAWVIADLEPPPWVIDELGRLLRDRRIVSAWRFLRALPSGSGRDARAPGWPEHDFPGATPLGGGQSLREAIVRLHERGVLVQAVTVPLALDGPFAHRLMAALGIDFLDLGWDEVSFMAYRPEFQRLAGPMSADIVARYAADAVARFGSRAGLAIGEVGSPGFPAPVPGYTDPYELQADLAACRTTSLPAVSIFSLDGMLEQGGLTRWLDAPAERPPRSEPKAGLIRLAIDAACRFLPEPE